MRVLTRRVSLFALLALLAACATRSRDSRSTASAASAGGEASTRASLPAESRPREMTWDEYYVDVEQRAKRAGGFVMWFNPPRPVRRPGQSAPAGADPTVNGPLSSPVR